MARTAEEKRLEEARRKIASWKKWGPYLSERQWGTVREDYSKDGNAWDYFNHDQARSRAYRWGEDGIAGVSDDKQRLCFALTLWNGKDPILKERMFGLSNREGNHGEDVKEYYFYLDNTPTHSYMKYLYKYPQRAYPYDQLVAVNHQRNRQESEYELIDTGVFDDDRYFDVFVEYAKAGPEDLLIRISVANRGREPAKLHLLPTLWFRNTWSWSAAAPKPSLRSLGTSAEVATVLASHGELGDRELRCEGTPTLLFTENETNNQRLFGTANATPYVKDAFHEYLLRQRQDAVNPGKSGTKAAAHYELDAPAGETVRIRLRLIDTAPRSTPALFGAAFDELLALRLREADDFYKVLTPATLTADEARVVRQALAGMLWSKQYYLYDANLWLNEHDANPLTGGKHEARNRDWYHMRNDDVISMPDKWEYPWYASWDLAFHCISVSAVDPDFAREQLNLMLREVYMHPSGQIPAYEWNFSDTNPPVHAAAALLIHRFGSMMGEPHDIEFLKRSFLKLELNFNWWVNRKDRSGKNVFEGGFLGLDNISVFDRSAALPTGGYIEQADGTAWVAHFCNNMVELSIAIATVDPSFTEMINKYVEHFFWIASGMNRSGPGMWDEEDGFYYDVLRLPDGSARRLKVRSMVGLLPLCATTIIEERQRETVSWLEEALLTRGERMPEVLENVHAVGPGHRGVANRGILALVNEQRLRRILARMLDEKEFLGPYGIRAVSRYHLEHPYEFDVRGQRYKVNYLPAESDSAMFGGNSNWRGPIWMPVNALIISALVSYYLYYGDSFKLECPTGSGRMMNLFEVSRELASRLTRLFLRDAQGRRPVHGSIERFQTDPLWRDYILFHEYFHGDNGAGLGASHQTGWTGLIARLIQFYGVVDPKRLLEPGVLLRVPSAA